MQKKLFIKTFGCQMNEYDSDKMADVLGVNETIVRTDTPDDADIILFNTCSVREKAQEKVFSDLGRVRDLKKKNPNLMIGVGGCVASQEGAAIVQRAPYVDVVFGPQTLHRLPDLLKQRHDSGKAQVDISFPEIEKFDHLPPAKVEGASAYVSIMEGCSKYCSYCVVPYTRGEEVSRRFDDVLTEVANLASQGVREITLLGQNVNAYRGVMSDGEIADFSLLIEYIAEFDSIERIRYVTSHPKEFTQRLIDTYAKVPKLVNHLYLPAQHGSDKILSAMKRGYTVLVYKSIIRRLRAVRPDANLQDETPHDVKLARLQILQKRIAENTRRYSEALVGSIQRVLVEGPSKRDVSELQGRAEDNRVVNFVGGPNAARLIGQFVDIHITGSHPYSLRGDIVIQQ